MADPVVPPMADKFLADIALMLDHIRKEGIALPTDLAKSAESVVNPTLAGETVVTPLTTEIMDLHGKLSSLIAPATPRSLAATTWFGRASWPVWLVMFIMVGTALVGLIGYISTLQFVAPIAAPTPTATLTPTVTATATVTPTIPPSSALLQTRLDNAAAVHSLALVSGSTTSSGIAPGPGSTPDPIQIQWNFIFAAMLGASFAGLFKALDYIQSRCFEPSYVPDYLIRLVIGTLAGVVLANFGSKLFEGNDTIAKLGPGVIALLGGYSAQAVREILDRLVEVLLTVVKGQDDSGAQKDKLEIAGDVLEITKTAGAAAPDVNAIKDQLGALLKKLKQ